MAKKIARSARGDMVDFDVLAITAAMASAPAPGVVQARREFIDEKDGLKSRAKMVVASAPVEVEPSVIASSASDAMSLALSAVEESAAAVEAEETATRAKK